MMNPKKTKDRLNEDSRAAHRRVEAWLSGLTDAELEALADLVVPVIQDVLKRVASRR